jgi:hypothetical protein
MLFSLMPKRVRIRINHSLHAATEFIHFVFNPGYIFEVFLDFLRYIKCKAFTGKIIDLHHISNILMIDFRVLTFTLLHFILQHEQVYVF